MDRLAKQSLKRLKIIGFFTRLLFLIFAVAGFLTLYFFNAKVKRCTETVSAVVVDFCEHTDEDGNNTYAPVFAYDYDSASHKSDYNVYSNEPEYYINDTVEININPDKPTECYLPSETSAETFLGWLFMGIGIFGFLLFSFVFSVISKAIKKGGNLNGNL